jgi:hypothetical protein
VSIRLSISGRNVKSFGALVRGGFVDCLVQSKLKKGNDDDEESSLRYLYFGSPFFDTGNTLLPNAMAIA